LIKLYNERVLQLVDPSEHLKDAYLKKSDGHLSTARLLLENDRLEEAVSIAYYSMYYSVLALFHRTGIKCENHTAAGMILQRVFDIDPADLVRAKKERIDKQYYVDTELTKDDVKALLLTAETFNGVMFDFIERLNNTKVEGYRDKLRELLSSAAAGRGKGKRD